MACKACNDKGFVRLNKTIIMCEECYNFADNAVPQSHEAMMTLVDVSGSSMERSAEEHFERTAYRGNY